MKKPSNILIDLITCDNKIIEVKVGGAALNIEKKKIKL